MVRGNDGFRRFSLFLEGHSKFEEMMIRGNDGFSAPRGRLTENDGFPLREAAPKRNKIKKCLKCKTLCLKLQNVVWFC